MLLMVHDQVALSGRMVVQNCMYRNGLRTSQIAETLGERT